jgi:hypothetical protein
MLINTIHFQTIIERSCMNTLRFQTVIFHLKINFAKVKETKMTNKKTRLVTAFVTTPVLTIDRSGGANLVYTAYKLGETGPGGGKIFYYSEAGFIMIDTGETCHYLEAAPIFDPNDGTKFIQWSSNEYVYTDVPGTKTEIGTGRKNTRIIFDLTNNPAVNFPAAYYCAAYKNNGKNDWFLPSKDELLELRNEGLSSPYGCWTSSQKNSEYAFMGFICAKGIKRPVRAIRAF